MPKYQGVPVPARLVLKPEPMELAGTMDLVRLSVCLCAVVPTYHNAAIPGRLVLKPEPIKRDRTMDPYVLVEPEPHAS